MTTPGRENTRDALVDAVLLECEYVEIDVQRCRGGAHVVHHDDVVMDGDRQVPIATLTLEQFTELAGPCLLLDEALQVFPRAPVVAARSAGVADPDQLPRRAARLRRELGGAARDDGGAPPP